MRDLTLLVVSDPADPYVPMLDALRDRAKVVIASDPQQFAADAPAARVMFNWTGKRATLEQTFRMAPQLEWVHSRNAGLDSILFADLVNSPIPLTNGRGVFSQSLGEFVILGMLFFAKDVRRLLRSQAAGQWDPFIVSELRGQTVGIVGYGDIGRAAAQRARAMGMRVLAVRRQPAKSQDDPLIDQVYGLDGLSEMLPQCDYVVCAAPLTPATRHLLGPTQFQQMKPGAIVLNVGRGPVIDEAALVEALQSGHLGGAALDVFEVEPLAADSPLFQMPNVLLSPHSADNTKTWLVDAMQFFIANFERFHGGQPLWNVVDKHAGY